MSVITYPFVRRWLWRFKDREFWRGVTFRILLISFPQKKYSLCMIVNFLVDERVYPRNFYLVFYLIAGTRKNQTALSVWNDFSVEF